MFAITELIKIAMATIMTAGAGYLLAYVLKD